MTISDDTRGRFLTGRCVFRRINEPLYKRVLRQCPRAADCAETHPGSLALSPSPVRIRGTLASIIDQPDDLRDLRTFHRALADVNRLRIVRRLAETPSTVTELIDHVGLSQPLVSHHLKRLVDAELLRVRLEGTFHYYAAIYPVLRSLTDYLWEDCCKRGKADCC